MKRFAFTALCMGFFMVILDVTIVNVSLPTIAQYFQTGLSHLQWVVDGYTLTFAGLLLLSGSLCDVFSAKLIFQIGLLSFVLTSVGCALSSSITDLIFFRLFQGMAGAFLLPSSLSLINKIYEAKEQRSKAIGIWAALGGIACTSGPFLGGLLTSLLSWRFIFLINLLIGFVSFILVSRYIDMPKLSTDKIKFDFVGQIIGFPVIFLLSYGLIEASVYGWGSPLIVSCFITSLILLAFFINVEKRIEHPIIPLSLFKNKIVAMALLVAMILNFSFYGELFMMPFYFENLRHYSIFQTGLALLPLSALAVFGSYFGGKFTGKLGPTRIIFIGFILAAIGYIVLLTLKNTTPEYGWLMIPFFAIGLGVSFATPAITFAAVNYIEPERTGIAAAVLNTLSQIGSLLGVAVFGTIAATSKYFINAMHITLGVGGLLFLLGAFLGFFGSSRLCAKFSKRGDFI